MVLVKVDSVTGANGVVGVDITLNVNGVDKTPRTYSCNSNLSLRHNKKNCSASSGATTSIYAGDVLITTPVDYSEYIINGVATTDAVSLLDELNKISCFVKSGASAADTAAQTALLQEIADNTETTANGYDSEPFEACNNTDPENKKALSVIKKFKISDGTEDISKREYWQEGVQLAAAPTSITYGACGEDALKEFTFSITPNLLDNIEDDYTVSITGVLQSDSYELIHNIPSNNGIEIVGHSWVDGQVIVTIHNNTGALITTPIDFILKQV